MRKPFIEVNAADHSGPDEKCSDCLKLYKDHYCTEIISDRGVPGIYFYCVKPSGEVPIPK